LRADEMYERIRLDEELEWGWIRGREWEMVHGDPKHGLGALIM